MYGNRFNVTNSLIEKLLLPRKGSRVPFIPNTLSDHLHWRFSATCCLFSASWPGWVGANFAAPFKIKSINPGNAF